MVKNKQGRATGTLIITLCSIGLAFSIIRSLLQKKKERRDFSSFFISTQFICNNIKLGGYVVTTSKAPQFGEEIGLDVSLEPFMIGKIVGIIDSSQQLVIIEMFPEDFYKFQSNIVFFTPFVSLDELNVSKVFKIKNFVNEGSFF